uniref:Uncharacterized protein n=1 Tax=Anguilla anguilla TaxID=7936 RepID=A0A0E9SCT2_ANGAN
MDSTGAAISTNYISSLGYRTEPSYQQTPCFYIHVTSPCSLSSHIQTITTYVRSATPH